MTTRPRWLAAALVVCSLLQLAGMAFFARGFFPYKKVLPGLAAKTTSEDYVQLGLAPLNPPPALFDRLVFVVIDALRRYGCLKFKLMGSDFMFSTDSSMSFVHK
jgi:ethanolamine phosphate transferase 2 subunit G